MTKISSAFARETREGIPGRCARLLDEAQISLDQPLNAPLPGQMVGELRPLT